MRLARELAQREGIFTGISAGAALAGALKIAAEAPAGSTILCMLPDTGERYLSTPLFEDTPIDMTAEEIAISRSTPAARFDAPAPQPAPKPANVVILQQPKADAEAEAALNGAIAGDPVVLFALEWCEFCWSIRKLFKALAIPYRSVDIDSVAFQKDEMGMRIRRALSAKTGMATIPQIFLGGTFIGGCIDTFDAYRSGALQAQLARLGVTWQDRPDFDPYGMLPKWLHPKPPAEAKAAE